MPLVPLTSEIVGIVGEAFRVPKVGGEANGGIHFSGSLLEDKISSRISGTDDGRNAWFDDSGFFTRYFFQRIAEEGHVVKGNVGDDGNEGSDDVGGIKTSAEANFNDGNVYTGISEVLESHGNGHFEKGGTNAVEYFLIGLYEMGDVLLTNHLSVYTDAFPEIF